MAEKHESRWLEYEDFAKATVVRLKNPNLMDSEPIKEIFDALSILVGDLGRNRLVLNLAVTKSLPSLALGKLVMLNHKIKASNGRLTICHLAPFIAEVLEITHLNRLLEIYPTEQEALQSFG